MNKLIIKISEVTLLFMFVGIIFTPAALTVVGPEKLVSTTEKRALSKIPALSFQNQTFSEYTQKFEAYLNDHFGFRSELIALNNWIFVRFFNKSPVNKVLIGKNDWLFYSSKQILENYAGINKFSAQEIKTIENTYETRRLWLKEKGVDFAYIVAPNKLSIYPENAPRGLSHISQETRLDQTVRALTQNTGVKIIDVRPALIAEKKTQQLYFKTDTHWNYYGAHVAYTDIIVKLFPDRTPIQAASINGFLKKASQIDTQTTGDLIHMLNAGKLHHPKHYSLKNSCATETDRYQITPSELGVKEPKPWQKGTPACSLIIKECSDGKGRAIIFRDSFFSAMEPLFSENFEAVIYIKKKYDATIIEPLIDKFRPDIIIEEVVERNLSIPPHTEAQFYENHLHAGL